MEKGFRFLFWACIASLLLGPLAGISFGIPGFSLYLTDILVGFLFLWCLFSAEKLWNLFRQDIILTRFGIFFLIASISHLFSPVPLDLSQRIFSSLYLLRLLAYSSLYLAGRFFVAKKLLSPIAVFRRLWQIGFFLSLFGWIQYTLYPDLRNLYYIGWDPHYKRIFSTYFDPNFLGLFFVLSLCLSFFYLAPRWTNWLVRGFVFITLLFTYSRSSFLSLLTVTFAYVSVKRAWNVLLLVLVSLGIGVLMLPRPAGEGVKLERLFSLEQRVTNWETGIYILKRHPVLGIGFNTTRYAKMAYEFPIEHIETSNSGAGFDNAFLFVLVTTGIVGFLAFLWFTQSLFLMSTFSVQLCLLAIFVHSLFLNSFFFPWIMAWMWIAAAMGRKSEI